MKGTLKLFFGLSLLMLILVIAGCGGGGGSSETPPIEKGPSSDYMGLQVGAKLVYKNVETPGDIVSTDTYEVLEIDTSGAFKTKYTSTGDPGDASGSYIQKGEDGIYLQTGHWDWDSGIEKLEMYPVAKMVIVNPVYSGFESDIWGEAIRQEVVTVPRGTFKAWFFHQIEPTDESGTAATINYYRWFVPNLGLIKGIYRTIKDDNDEIIDSGTACLESYSF